MFGDRRSDGTVFRERSRCEEHLTKRGPHRGGGDLTDRKSGAVPRGR